MLEFFKIAREQVDEKTAKENNHVAAFKAEHQEAVNEKLAKFDKCKAAWKARNAFLNGVNSREYPNGLGSAAMYVNSLAQMHDPIAVMNMGVEEWENVSYQDLNDGLAWIGGSWIQTGCRVSGCQ